MSLYVSVDHVWVAPWCRWFTLLRDKWLGFQALHTSHWPGRVTQVDRDYLTCYLDSSLLSRNRDYYCNCMDYGEI